ncbi:MAG: hypothetical protein HY673_10325 [Chloroflexi bacterium]|nr:hypothetical protein [Chloroflexota bacterium]
MKQQAEPWNLSKKVNRFRLIPFYAWPISVLHFSPPRKAEAMGYALPGACMIRVNTMKMGGD